ncbi:MULTISPECIES: ABC transporter ATP-binding protein [Actinoalloteichus]|uniref:ABC-type spermidine/putrescine transport system, ATPase component n=1 Tax=Actinoalloteichus fjordicus TaxID=1612552 RepID=A0AAC9PR31_9PSEU|nr:MULTISPECIES: ABC transporter ATP-binding protein [Actinoalloteichus]APU13670.1 ABC-type spermidine/putrescine transport system, ATPase component [Actinoalloteichus fjordicus]APU19616.1 ABC-type spermidine/putrescine transport system, ATPase component [Actinoalloteichus sp. GBA129-24]
MTLDARLIVRRDTGFRLDLALRVRPGEVVALLGPNGAGKTTALRALAGLLPVDEGRIELAGEVVDEPGRPDRFVPPERRNLGVVFQDHRLFGHLSALENVAFGPRARGVRRRVARASAMEWLGRLGLAELARRLPARLSGGQAQRVALARALAVRPGLLLLDEPTAALDAGSRLAVRAELSRQLADFDGCAVLVTHDPLDAMALATRLVVLEAGSVVQDGTPAEVATRPRTDYVAALVGLNLCRGTVDGADVEIEGFGRVAQAGGRSETGSVLVAFPPAAVTLHREAVPCSRPVTVAEVAAGGIGVRVRLADPPGISADVTPAAMAELGLAAGARLWAAVRPDEVRCYPP